MKMQLLDSGICWGMRLPPSVNAVNYVVMLFREINILQTLFGIKLSIYAVSLIIWKVLCDIKNKED